MARPARKTTRNAGPAPRRPAPRGGRARGEPGTKAEAGPAPSARLSRETLVALAPAAEHLLRAASEIVAAVQAAIEALPEETRRRSRWSFGSAKAALDLASRLALAGAERARAEARRTLKAEAAREILAALDARAARLDGRAGDALRTVRGAVADALGAPFPRRGRSVSRGAATGRLERPAASATGGRRAEAAAPARRRASGRLRRIPPVSFDQTDSADAEE